MDSKYVGYGAFIVGGGAVALWAGLSPFFLLLLLACPLMMFLMMRGGGHGGMPGHSAPPNDVRPDTAIDSPAVRDDDNRRHH